MSSFGTTVAIGLITFATNSPVIVTSSSKVTMPEYSEFIFRSKTDGEVPGAVF